MNRRILKNSTQLNSLISGLPDAKTLRARIPKKSNRLLVAESDGLTLRALVVGLHGDKVIVEQTLKSRAMEPRAAIGDLLKQLEERGVTPPKQAILLNTNIIPTLLELPIEGKEVLPDQRMLELVRWEMEALLTEQLSQWNLGWLLIGRGYLTEEQRDEIIDDMQALKLATQASGGRTPARFGEEAIKREWINREQLEECLALQESLHLFDSSVDCSWQPSPIQAGRQPGLWLCAAMSSTLRQSWVEAFAHHQVRLQWLYPAAGATAPSLAQFKSPQVVVEIQPGVVVCSRVEEGQVVFLGLIKCCDHTVKADEIIELCQSALSSDIEKIYLTGCHPRRENLAKTLSEKLQRPFVPLQELLSAHCVFQSALEPGVEHGIESNKADEFGGMLSSCFHFYGLTSADSAIQLQGEPPPPPLYKQSIVQLGAALGLLLMIMTGNEAWALWKTKQIDAEIAENEHKTSLILAANEKLASKDDEYQSVKKSRDEWAATFQKESARKQAIESVLIKRQQFVEALLPMLGRVVPDRVVVTAFEEQQWYRFKLNGWGMNQEAIDSFNELLIYELESWGLYIANSPSEVEHRNGIEGYRFSFMLKPLLTNDQEPSR